MRGKIRDLDSFLSLPNNSHHLANHHHATSNFDQKESFIYCRLTKRQTKKELFSTTKAKTVQR